jgi:hypothetical protein
VQMIFQANEIQNLAGIATLTSNKIDFKTIIVRRDKEGHYIKMKWSIHQ